MSHAHGPSPVSSIFPDRERSPSPLDATNHRPLDNSSIRTHNDTDSEFEARIVDGHDDTMEAKRFNLLKRRVEALKKELLSIRDTAHQLGSSARMYFASSHLHDRVDETFRLFHANTSRLFSHLAVPLPDTYRQPKGELKGDHDASRILSQLDLLATDVRFFLGCLNEFPPYNDDVINSSILALENDLKYWASWIKYYEGQFTSHAVQQYLHDRSVQFGEHLEQITSALQRFMHLGIPTIRFTQHHSANNLQNLATTATFLSAVTATTLQFSYPQNRSHLAIAVNGFWFSSLVLSIGAAVNSVLGLTWKQAMYRSPRSQAPRWVLLWVDHSPTVFLVLSVLAFSAGLVLFTFSTSQHIVVRIITAALSAFSIVGLASLSIWFTLERWIFVRYKGEKSLWEIWVEVKGWSSGLERLPEAIRMAAGRANSIFWRMAGNVWSISSRVETEIRITRHDSADDGSAIGAARSTEAQERLPYTTQDIASGNSQIRDIPMFDVVPPVGPCREQQDHDSVSSNEAKLRHITNVLLAIVKLRRKLKAQISPPSLPRSRHLDGCAKRDWTVIDRLQPTQRLAPREINSSTGNAWKQLYFSPDGQMLLAWAESGQAVIYRTAAQFTPYCALKNSEMLPESARWSYDGRLILARFKQSILVWSSEDGQLMRRIRCPRRVHCMELGANSRNTGNILCIEGKSIVQRDYHGAIHNTFSKLTDRATPLDIASVPSDQHIIILVSVRVSPDGVEPKKFKSERQLIVFDTDNEKILSRTPALSSAHKIHLSSDSKIVLVDCDADRKLTQVWRREMIDGTPSGRIQLRHTFVAKAHPLLGESFFAGQGDRCVACLTEDGSIYTWDRESGRLIRRILPTESDAGSISCATWNTCAEGVLATGTSNGEIVMWSASLERPMERIVEDGVMHIDTSRAVNDVDRPNPRRKRSDTM